MLARFFRRQPKPDTELLYGTIQAAARQPTLYRDCGVPDTVEGRFETLVLFTALALRRLSALGEPAAPLAAELVDTFFADIDRSIREIGIGDISVPKRMKRIAKAFYGRAMAYGDAIEAGDDGSLADAIRRNLLAGGGGDAAALAGAAKAWVASLDESSLEAIAAGRVRARAADEIVPETAS